jgi:hypothetical protein
MGTIRDDHSHMALSRLVTTGTRANHLLRFGLAVTVGLIVGLQLIYHLFLAYPFGVDIEIPYRAAQRFATSGSPYLASAFSTPSGATQPFLYPPSVLVLVVPLTALPLALVKAAWLVVVLGAAILACRRLAIPALYMPFVLAWPPFAEAIWGGNVQIVLFAVFTSLFWRRGAPEAFRPIERDTSDPSSTANVALKLVVEGGVKVAQFHSWLFMVRNRTRAAALAAAIGLGLVLVTVPLTGTQLWFDWIDQVARASDPAYRLGGFSLPHLVPGIGHVVAILACLAILTCSWTRAGVWVGFLSVLGAFSLYVFGLLFLLPGMLLIRREIALVAAGLIATYTYGFSWLAVAIIGATLVLARQWPAVLETDPTPPGLASGGRPFAPATR